jgi:hypothetical protein
VLLRDNFRTTPLAVIHVVCYSGRLPHLRGVARVDVPLALREVELALLIALVDACGDSCCVLLRSTPPLARRCTS